MTKIFRMLTEGTLLVFAVYALVVLKSGRINQSAYMFKELLLLRSGSASSNSKEGNSKESDPSSLSCFR